MEQGTFLDSDMSDRSWLLTSTYYVKETTVARKSGRPKMDGKRWSLIVIEAI